MPLDADPEKHEWESSGCVDVLYKFEVPGDPRGYTTTTHRDKGTSARYKKYKEYCQRVREFASLAGVPIPLTSSKDNQLFIRVRAYFRNGVHADVENVRKGCVDALFYDFFSKKKGDDKWVGGEFSLPLYDKLNPRLEVEIGEYLRKSKHSSGLDLLGKKFGALKVVEFAGVRRHKSYWLCHCDCGIEKTMQGAGLVNGRLKTCGCGGKVIPGASIGNWEVLRRDRSVKSGPTRWLCRCVCGKEKVVWSSNLAGGTSGSCGCRGVMSGYANWNRIYRSYKKNAEVRDLIFEITKEQFEELGSMNCEYCGASPSMREGGGNRRNPIRHNGLDRINSDLGYTMDNCVPCCSICNFAKGSLSVIKFNKWRVRFARRTRETIRLGDETRVPIKLKKKRKKAV